jgi:hypothetical protein
MVNKEENSSPAKVENEYIENEVFDVSKESEEDIPVDELIEETAMIEDVELSEPIESQTMETVLENAQTPIIVETVEKYLLTGIVDMKTYVKIYIDDKPPKEYIFKPGSRPQWEAGKGFDILIGNAAGIIFDFNGTMIKDLGSVGKVVRLKLPKDFESSLYED